MILRHNPQQRTISVYAIGSPVCLRHAGGLYRHLQRALCACRFARPRSGLWPRIARALEAPAPVALADKQRSQIVGVAKTRKPVVGRLCRTTATLSNRSFAEHDSVFDSTDSGDSRFEFGTKWTRVCKPRTESRWGMQW